MNDLAIVTQAIDRLQAERDELRQAVSKLTQERHEVAQLSHQFRNERDTLLAQRDELLAALKGMARFWKKWPEFVPAPEFLHEASKAVQEMNGAIARAEATK